MEEQAKIVKDLLELNVNDHTESKNGLRYLSWPWYRDWETLQLLKKRQKQKN